MMSLSSQLERVQTITRDKRLLEQKSPLRKPSAATGPLYALISVHGDPAAEIGRDGAGGQNVYVRELGLALARRGYQVDMFTRRESPDQETIVHHAPGCRTIRLKAGPAEFVHRDHIFDYLPEFTRAWVKFQQQYQRDYNLIHTNYWDAGWVGLQLKFKLGLPLVHTYHSIGAIKYQNLTELPLIAPTRLAVEQMCLEQADRVIATSPQEAENLRQLVSEHGRIQIIPCGTNPDHFGSVPRDVARQQLGLAEDLPMILYVGRFDPRKGIETLVRACAHLSEPFRLYLVGGSIGEQDSQEQKRIRTLVAELGLTDRTVFTGQVDQSGLPVYYGAADLCVIPSYYEPFGLVTLEAMAAKTPVIASDVGGLRYTVISGKTGLLVPPQDPEALVWAIRDALHNPLRWRDFGEAGAHRVRTHFSWSAVAGEIHHLYGTINTPAMASSLPARIAKLRHSA